MKQRIKIYSFIYVFTFYCTFVFSQEQNTDSLIGLSKTGAADTNKVKLLCSISKQLEGQPGIKYASDALELASQLHFMSGIAQAHALLGKHYYFKGNFSSSLDHSIKAFHIADSTGNNSIAGYACLFIGYNHFENRPRTSLEYYKNCIYYSKMSRNEILESYAYSAIGNVYEKWDEGKAALGYYLLSLKIREQKGNTDEVISSLIETARGYNRLTQYERSNEVIQKALKIAEEKGENDQNLVYLYQMVGHDYSGRLNDYRKALDHFMKAYQILVKNNSFSMENLDCIRPIAGTYLKLKDYENASKYYKIYFDLLEKEQKKIDKKLFQSQFTLEKEVEKQKLLLKDSEILKQKIQLQDRKTLFNFSIFSSVVLIVFTFFIYRNYRLKQRSNIVLDQKVKERTMQLEETNSQLQSEINERKLAKEKLRDSEKKLTEINKELESFIYKASHDLKGPLTSSKGLTGLALNSKSIEEMLQYLKLIDASIDKLDGILLDLQEITIIRQGKVIVTKIDIVKTIHNTISNFSNYENFNNIKFTIDNQLVTEFHTDAILMQTVLRNILENAVKYSRKIQDPYVKITLKREDKYNLIQVSDNGIGIHAEFQNKIFDVFFRANEVTKGSGLGLYIVKNAVQKLNGKVELAFSKPKEGSTFNLYFMA